ncbi:MAG: hypothetical protein L0H84_03660, partial [Pseudonocardia sp.]|nr:hypothetical protein [Pseudonocardia sp.]
MAQLRAFFDGPQWPAAFVLAIVTITIASLLAQRVRTKRLQHDGGSRAQRPWPAPEPITMATAPAPLVGLVPIQPDAQPVATTAAVPQQRGPLPEEPEPVGTVLLAVTPGGPVEAARPAELLELAPGVHVRIRRADVDADALVAVLPDDVAIHLDDLTAAPTDPTRTDRFRRSVDTACPRLPCAVLLTGPAGGPPAVAVTTMALQPLLTGDSRLAALLAMATAADARPEQRRAFDTALLAAVRALPVGTVIDLDGLRTSGRWIEANHDDLRARYAVLLGSV